jgi:ATP-dependent helicase HrpB
MSAPYPILDAIPRLKELLEANNTVILQAPPGAGKSTVLPLQLIKEPWMEEKKIIMLEPRRLAARSVAFRMASLYGDQVGETVGYRIRFETRISSGTRIEIVTEGILTRMIQRDPTLEGIQLVIFDEFHERSLQADLGLAFCRHAQKLLRPDLRLLIMSATLDGEKLSAALDKAPVISSIGRQFPVELRYEPGDIKAPLPVRMAKMIHQAMRGSPGDILAFMPGVGEIARTKEILESGDSPIAIHELYGDLPIPKQQEAILPRSDGKRKVVLATSIAETSLTIEGVSCVVDSGLTRLPRFDPSSALTRLETIQITLDAADQRAGRAGRLGPGVCYRLWSKASHTHLIPSRTPEILEADLCSFTLEIMAWGVRGVQELVWITPPPAGACHQAIELLEELQAISDNLITPKGKRMMEMPTHPRFSHMILDAEADSSALALAIDLVAILEERDFLPRESGSDLTLRVEHLRRWRVQKARAGESRILERIEHVASVWRKSFHLPEDNSLPADADVGKLLIKAYPDRLAQQIERGGERFKLATGRVVRLAPHDALFRNPWIVAAHVDAAKVEGKIFLAAPVLEADLESSAYDMESVYWDSDRDMIMGQQQKRIGGLILSAQRLEIIPREKRIRVLCELIRAEGLGAIGWGPGEEQWQSRVTSLKLWRPGEPWPNVSQEYLLTHLEAWLNPFLDGVGKRSELNRLPLESILTTLLPWELTSRLNVLAPASLPVPSGSRISLRYYSDGSPPALDVRLQEVFGWKETPTVNDGQTSIVLHLLSPGYKPVQVTKDLKSFWNSTYHEVRKELRIRYRKHSWPEDPWTAKAVKGVKRKESPNS